MEIFITGDFCPIGRAEINNVSSKVLMSDSFRTLFKSADLKITNLECPLTNHITAITKSGPALKVDPKNILFLKENDFNLVTLANNHIMDYGSEGLKETINHLEKNNIDYVGAGKSTDEIEVIFKTKNGFTVGIINVCENEWSTQEREGYRANGFSEIDMFYSIKKAKAKAHKVIVIHHGGHEMYKLPSPRLKRTFRFFVDCGADAVINHHTHCVGGDEVYRNAPIFYSLGNFIFDNSNQRNSIWNYGMAVTLNCSKENITCKKHYFEQFNLEPIVQEIDKESLPYNVEDLNRIIENDQMLNDSFTDFISQKKKLYNSFLEPVKSKYLIGLINRGYFPSLWSKRKKKILRNLISCESHREILSILLSEDMTK